MAYFQDENIVLRNVEDEVKESYLRYSMSVIISRALPDVRDGLKPSQRRILYAMRQLNLLPGGKHRKCAKISGDTSGDYHPHGEQVIYPTLVRMAQDWIMRYPLINGQGNFGSVDGDPPAAMRYTEARLTHSSLALMEDLDKDTVDKVANYDETKLEPTVFPAKFPNLLLNGSSGIAVGMATNIPPHNFKELIAATILLLENPLASIDDIMQVMPGPDFPTGGLICGFRGIYEAYHTGRGRVIMRAVTHTENMDGSNDRERIIIDELPYGVNKSRLIEHIAELVNNKEITGISDLRDESDKDGVRISLDLKRGEITEVILNQLFKYTEMQSTFGCNMLALDKGLPRTMSVKQIISSWIEHRIEVIRRRTRFDLNKAEARAHILEGYLKATDNLDAIVKIIRGSSNRLEAKVQLEDIFEFTEKQANAVLELRLYQLTGMERDKVQEEYDVLLVRILELKAILASEDLVRDVIKQELQELLGKHTSPRKTQIVAAEGDMDMEDLIANEPVVITISQDDYIKRMPLDTFKEQRRGGHGIAGMQKKRDNDIIKNVYVAHTHDHLLIFTNLGRCYWTKAWKIAETGRRSKGKPIINLLTDLMPEEKVATILNISSFEQDAAIIMTTRNGIVKKTDLSAYSNPRRKGVYAINIDEGDEVIAAQIVEKGQEVMLFTHQGMAIRFEEDQVRSMGRVARGVRGATLKEGDYVIRSQIVNGDEAILMICEQGFGKRSLVGDYRKTKRGSKGVRAIITNDRNGSVVDALSVTDEDGVLMMSQGGQTVRTNMNDLRVMGRNTQGVRLVNLKDQDILVVAQKIDGSLESIVDDVEEDNIIEE